MAMADQRSTPCAVRSRLVVGSCKQVPHRASIHRLYSPELSSHRIKAWERRQCGGFGYGGVRERADRGRVAVPVVLVVEDVVRMLIAERLRSRGFDVVEAGDGAEAVRVLEAGLPVRAVLSDIHMPGARLDGIGLARWIHAHRPRLPVLLGSGIHANLSSADAVLSSGPSDQAL